MSTRWWEGQADHCSNASWAAERCNGRASAGEADRNLKPWGLA